MYPSPPPSNSSTPPDISQNMSAWFQYFDRGAGLDKEEFIGAVSMTMKLSTEAAQSLRSSIYELWPLFDTDGSGRISHREFIQPGGLGETVVAQLRYVSGGSTSVPLPPAHSSASTYQVPNLPTTGYAPYPLPAPTQPQNQQFCCGSCRFLFAIDVSKIAPGVQQVSSHCPNCRCLNQVVIQPRVVVTIPTAVPAYGAASMQQGPRGPMDPYWFRPVSGLTQQRAPMNITLGNVRGFKRALLIGINYVGQKAELRGCCNDASNVYRLLTVTYGWPPSCFRILTDARSSDNMQYPCYHMPPTRANITDSLRWLSADVQPGDSLFFLYSGHGAQQADPHGYEEDGMNETILPVDHKQTGMISDDEISQLVVQTLPERARLTAVMDCCHSGTGLDLPYTWTHRTRNFIEETNPYHSLGDVQLFSGCEDDGVSSDAAVAYRSAGGAMTTAFCEALRFNPCPTYVDLLHSIQCNLQRNGFRQTPQLSSSQRFDISRPFILDDSVPNSNSTIGRTVRRIYPPRKRRYNDPNMDSMLGIGAAALGGLLLAELLF